MPRQIHRFLNPKDPAQAETRAAIWLSLMAEQDRIAVSVKFRRRWYLVTARPSGGFYIRFRSNGKEPSASVQADLIHFMGMEM